MPGNRTSSTTTSGRVLAAMSKAASADAAVATRWPWRSNAFLRAQEMASSSSTIRMVAGMVSGYAFQAVAEMLPQGPGGRAADAERPDPEPTDVGQDRRADQRPRHRWVDHPAQEDQLRHAGEVVALAEQPDLLDPPGQAELEDREQGPPVRRIQEESVGRATVFLRQAAGVQDHLHVRVRQ